MGLFAHWVSVKAADVQLSNGTVIEDGAMTWEQICTPAHPRFFRPPSQRGNG